MFEKLYSLVKSNAGKAVYDNPLIASQHKEAVLNDASGTIIEVLKGKLENGQMKDLVSYFRFSGVNSNTTVKAIVNKFANKLNLFYNIDPVNAFEIANALIPPVMKELVKQSKNNLNHDFSLGNFLSKLNGNKADLNNMVNRLSIV